MNVGLRTFIRNIRQCLTSVYKFLKPLRILNYQTKFGDDSLIKLLFIVFYAFAFDFRQLNVEV